MSRGEPRGCKAVKTWSKDNAAAKRSRKDSKPRKVFLQPMRDRMRYAAAVALNPVWRVVQGVTGCCCLLRGATVVRCAGGRAFLCL